MTTTFAPSTEAAARNAAMVTRYNELFAAKQFDEWSQLFQPDCEFTAAYPVPPVPPTIVGRENLYGFLSGLAAAVGEVRVTPVALHHTTDPDVVISQHRLSVEMPAGRYENTYISVIRFRDGLIAGVLEFYGSREHAAFLTALGVA